MPMNRNWRVAMEMGKKTICPGSMSALEVMRCASANSLIFLVSSLPTLATKVFLCRFIFSSQ